jgi:hypothetical protein
MRLLWRLYRRRVVNVNVNVVLAGILALMPTVAVIHLVTSLASFPEPQNYTPRQVFLINGITFVSDIIFDVAIYYALHWLANHMRGRIRPSQELEAAAHPTFIKDATQVQVERIVLSPLFYLTALGCQHLMMHAGVRATVATAAGIGVAIVLTRVIHTFWMLRGERRRKKLAVAVRPAP